MTHSIDFPKLGLHFDVNPTAFSIGNFTVQWYGILIATGFVLAIIYAMRVAKKMNINTDALLDCIIVGLICGIVGARLYYVIFYPGDKYINDPMQIFNIKEGGLGIYGGIIGGLLGGSIVAKIRKMKVPAVLDLAAIGYLIGQCVGRWGNFVNQEAFGVGTDLPWGMQSDMTSIEVVGPVHPCFLYESLLCFAGFLLLHFFNKYLRRYDGQTFLLYLIWYGVSRFFIEGLRTDSLMLPYVDIRVSQAVAAATVLLAVILLIVFARKTSLTGCGCKKIMELNGISIEKKSDDIEDVEAPEVSTIFTENKENAEDDIVEAASDSEKENTEEDAVAEKVSERTDSAAEEQKAESAEKSAEEAVEESAKDSEN